MTGQLEEEKMQVYVRLGIRLLYKGAKSQMEGNRGTHSLALSRHWDSNQLIASQLVAFSRVCLLNRG